MIFANRICTGIFMDAMRAPVFDSYFFETNSNFTRVYDMQITMFNGVCIDQFIVGGPHIAGIYNIMGLS